MNQERLKKNAELVKRGVDGEKINAEKLLRGLCKKHNLIYEKALNDLSIKRFSYKYKGKMSKKLASYIMLRYAMNEEVVITSYEYNHSYIYFKTTEELYQDFLAAVEKIRLLFDREKRKFLEKQKKERKYFLDAFQSRHDLFYKFEIKGNENEKEEKLTDEDLERYKFQESMSGDMDEDLKIYKALEKSTIDDYSS